MFSNRKSIAVILSILLLCFGMTSVLAAGEEEKNIADTHRFYEQVTKGNLNVIDELVSADFVGHEEIPGIKPNREGMKQLYPLNN